MVHLQNENKGNLRSSVKKHTFFLLFLFLLFGSYKMRTKLLKTSFVEFGKLFFWIFIESKNVFHVGLYDDGKVFERQPFNFILLCISNFRVCFFWVGEGREGGIHKRRGKNVKGWYADVHLREKLLSEE